jgi:hypothetical protein
MSLTLREKMQKVADRERIAATPHSRCGDCPVCGEAFEVRTPSRARRFEPNRRCGKQKRPGARVNRREKHKMRGAQGMRSETSPFERSVSLETSTVNLSMDAAMKVDSSVTDPRRAPAPDNWMPDADSFECCCAACSSQDQ